MNDINERFKEIRKKFHKTQDEWGSIIGISRNGICDIESGRRNVTEKHIKLLCSAPIDGKYINEEYLRTGEGKMFKELPEEDEVADIVSGLLEDGRNNPFYEIILEIILTYRELSPKSQEVLRDTSARLLENLRKKKED